MSYLEYQKEKVFPIQQFFVLLPDGHFLTFVYFGILLLEL